MSFAPHYPRDLPRTLAFALDLPNCFLLEFLRVTLLGDLVHSVPPVARLTGYLEVSEIHAQPHYKWAMTYSSELEHAQTEFDRARD